MISPLLLAIGTMFRGLSPVVASALSVAGVLVVVLPILQVWNVLVDNPRVTKIAQAKYVAIADFERIKAERDIAKQEQQISLQTIQRLQQQASGYASANREYLQELNSATPNNQSFNNELEELAKTRQRDVPDLDQLGILERLRNR